LFRNDYRVNVVGFERVTEQTGEGEDARIESKYLIFTETADGTQRVFENTDSVVECAFDRCKFNSSDVHAKAMAAKEKGLEIDVTAYGFRVPLFSMYENVVSVKPVLKQ